MHFNETLFHHYLFSPKRKSDLWRKLVDDLDFGFRPKESVGIPFIWIAATCYWTYETTCVIRL